MNDPDKKKPGKGQKSVPEDDRTIFFGSDSGSDQPDPDRTILAGTESPPEDDRTILATNPPALDEDRTILAAEPAAPPRDDPDRTIFAGGASEHVAAESPEDLDRTVLASDPLLGQPDATGPVVEETAADQTVVVTGLQFSQEARQEPISQPPGEDATVVAPDGPGGESEQQTRTLTQTESGPIVSLPPGTAPTPLSSLEPGVVINNMYRVEERLDQGGMGRVFRGVEIGTGESVAIKVILPEMAEDATVARMFRREARTLRQLHHDAIVRYFAYVPPDEQLNLHALVMGFIEGTKLSDKLKDEGALSREQVIKLTLRLADGLERAHKIGVVHRDLSPDNIMLQDGDITKAVIIDFGISRSSKIKDVTIGNEFAGKLKYVSPEQLGAFGGEAEAPSDVYSLGLLMIAMLTGVPLNMGGSIVEAVQMRQSVPDLSNLPEEFQDLLTGMLQPDPAQRTSGMGAVIEALQALQGGTGLGGSRMRGTLPPAPDRSVPGLQAVPMAATSSTTSAPKSMTDDAQDAVRRQRRGGSGRAVMLLAMLLTFAGAGGYYFWGDEIFPSAADEAGEATDPVDAGLVRVEGSRATFLATEVPGDCAYATRRARGENAGLIEAFALDLKPLQSLGAAFGAQFGATPEMIGRNVPELQCAALDFARSFQGTKGSGIELSLTSHSTPREEGIVGSLHGSGGRQNWLALIGPNGQVYSLMRQFDDAIGEQRKFAFRMPSAPPGIYLVIATASEKALVRAGAMQDGTTVAEILPLVQRELAVDGQGAVDIAFVEITR